MAAEKDAESFKSQRWKSEPDKARCLHHRLCRVSGHCDSGVCHGHYESEDTPFHDWYSQDPEPDH